MTEALIVNPYNIEETADRDQGSPGNAPGGAPARYNALMAAVRKSDAGAWAQVVPGAARARAQRRRSIDLETPAPIRDALEKLQQSHGATPRQDDAANVGARHGVRDRPFDGHGPVPFQSMSGLASSDTAGATARASDRKARPSIPAHVYAWAMSTADSIESPRPGASQGARRALHAGRRHRRHQRQGLGAGPRGRAGRRAGAHADAQARHAESRAEGHRGACGAAAVVRSHLGGISRAWSRAARRSPLPTSAPSTGRAFG